jgi:MFS transporter, PHS family, inorganic phosphate transporter
MVFAMQAAGLIVGPALAAILLASGLSHDITWRLLLAFGAVPAMAVFQMRRHMAETPRFLLANGQHDDFHAAGHSVLGTTPMQKRAAADAQPRRKASFAEGFARLTAHRNLVIRLVGASAAWFLMDFAYYGNTVSSPRVLAAIEPNDSLVWHVVMQLVVFAIAAVPGYFVAAWFMDRMGRKAIQNLGFLMMAVAFIQPSCSQWKLAPRATALPPRRARLGVSSASSCSQSSCTGADCIWQKGSLHWSAWPA